MYKTYIFDLGNVLISFNHDKMYRQIAHLCGIPVTTLKNVLMTNHIGVRYERGILSSIDIDSLLSQYIGRDLPLDDLLYASSNIFSYRPKMIQLLQELKHRDYRLILLSNTNEAHYQFLSARYTFFKLFDATILSFEVHALKPEKAIFEIALERAKCCPEECLYIDDIPEYITAAQSLGICGHVFTSLPALITALKIEGISIP